MLSVEESRDPNLVLHLLQHTPLKGDYQANDFLADDTVTSALHRLMPLITREIIETWRNQDRKRLLPFVKVPFVYPYLTLETLRILSYCADEEDLKEVRLVRQRISWREQVQAEVRDQIEQAAVNCADAITKQLAMRAVSTALLRSSDQPTEASGNELLRASISTNATPTTELLRPLDESSIEWTGPH